MLIFRLLWNSYEPSSSSSRCIDIESYSNLLEPSRRILKELYQRDLARFISQGCVLNDRIRMDQELYKNIMFVKHYKGELQELGLTFTVDTQVMGLNKTIELIPGGSEIDVTDSNAILYIYKLAHYHLNVKLAPVMEPFMFGLPDMVDLRWLGLFNISEMRMILSSTLHTISIDDWRSHTSYEECSSSSKVCQWFWEIVSSWSEQEKSSLLKFVISCSRPPLQGFKELQPKFTIRIIPIREAASASTSSASSDGTGVGGFFRRIFSSKPNQAQLPSAAT